MSALIVMEILIILETKMNKITDFLTGISDRFGLTYFFGQPADTITFGFLLGAFTLALITCLGYYFYLRSKSKQQKPYVAYAKAFFWTNLTLILVGLLHLFGRYENLTFLSWRFWMYLVLATLIAYNGWFFSKKRQELEDELEKHATRVRKQRWLSKGKK